MKAKIMHPFSSMNLFQNANLTARFLIFSALVAGISEAVKLHASGKMPNELFISMILITIFIILFHIKATFDDHNYFETAFENNQSVGYIGFFLAVATWIFSGVAALLVYDPDDSIQMLGISFLISSAWIIVHLGEITIDRTRRNKEVFISVLRQKWLLINIMYLGCFVVYLGWIDPVVKPHQNYPLFVLLIILAYDVLSNYPFKGGTSHET